MGLVIIENFGGGDEDVVVWFGKYRLLVCNFYEFYFRKINSWFFVVFIWYSIFMV